MKSRLLSAAAVSALAVVPLMVSAPPAAATVTAVSCSVWQDKAVPTSGTNTRLDVKLCVERNSAGNYRAKADFGWDYGGSNKFNNLDLIIRLEKFDGIVQEHICDFTAEVNKDPFGYGFTCISSWKALSSPVTTDGTFFYDIANDGVSGFEWNLGGSPSL
ncbi:hypothetical protein [Streptomyces sp. NBC_00690]|uniref:hypothetical protein n=1 Tax=Streptomyces sp. NBC_00690 TaxID=2975808 RepID=UPI002E29A59A|nr:hypothetical protein [Streptomyces sp. NBC_00690]